MIKIFLLTIICFSIINKVHNSVIEIPTIKVLQGPSSKTTLLGPDGSQLNAVAPGGTVATEGHDSGLVAAGPAILPSGPEHVVAGPAGRILTSHTLAGPAIVPAVAVAAAAPAPILHAEGGLIAGDIGGLGVAEGEYVHDNSEALYDDGSYKGEH